MTPPALHRRALLGGALALAAAARPAAAQLGSADEVVPLWPGAVPGDAGGHPARRAVDQGHDPLRPDRWVTGIERPVLVVRRPARPCWCCRAAATAS